jgi:hypothetical protein
MDYTRGFQIFQMKNSKKYFWSVSINVTTGIIFENNLPYLQITRRKKNEERNSSVHYGPFWPNVVSNSLF